MKRLNDPSPKSYHLNSLIKNHKHKKPKNTPTQSLLLQTDLVLLENPPPPLYPTISNPIWTYQSQALIHQTQAQQQPNQINIQALLPSSGCLANTPFQPPTIRLAPPRIPQPELINYSNTPQFSTEPIIFANADKTSSSEVPELIHIVLKINNTPHDIGLISDTSSADPLRSQFSSPTPSKSQEIPLIHHKDQ